MIYIYIYCIYSYSYIIINIINNILSRNGDMFMLPVWSAAISLSHTTALCRCSTLDHIPADSQDGCGQQSRAGDGYDPCEGDFCDQL